jgi:hypothetical protein
VVGVIGPPDRLVKVTVFAAEVWPTVTMPKSSEVGLKVNAAIPVPVRVRSALRDVGLAATVNVFE